MRKNIYALKLIVFSVMTVIIVSMAGIYTNISQNRIIHETSLMLSRTNIMTQLYLQTDNMQRIMGEYISIDSTESRYEYYGCQKKMQQYIKNLSSSFDDDDIRIKLDNISKMSDNYILRCDEIIYAKNHMQTDVYTKEYEAAGEQCRITVNYIKSVMALMLENADKYSEISEKVRYQSRMNYFFICVVVIFVMISIALNIRKYSADMINQKEIERKFHEQEIKTLRIENSLRESELMALQSQINPHFIFNTINIGAKMAMLNDDESTCEYLENVSDIFRYNLKGLDLKTTIEEEIQNARSYLYLLSIRFGDLFTFSFDIDENVTGYFIPRMSVQPLLENSYIHGICNMEEGGQIKLSVYDAGSFIAVDVIDNGAGMNDQRIRQILSCPEKTQANTSHTTGIGINNVIQRMKLFYDCDDVIDIICTDGYTHVKLKIPKRKI